MHEASLARGLLKAALDASDGPVLELRGWVAEDEALSLDALQLHFDALSQGTRAEGARLDLELTHLQVRCAGCSQTYAPEHHLRLCPHCGSTDGTLLGTPGLGLRALTVA
mgnify:CR=1 FL=1